jgi:hypothetical protein
MARLLKESEVPAELKGVKGEVKSFSHYVAENKKEYNYVLKFAVADMTDSMIDTLESCLTKYDLKKASSFRQTPIQESPLDFPNIKNTAVFICDLSLGYPGSLDFLRTYICNNLGISPAQLAVYSSNDPRQIETDLFLDRNSPEFKEKYKTQLGSDYEPDGEEVPYGEKYNISFLKELDKVRRERKTNVVTNPLSPDEAIDHTTLPKGYHDFNSSKNLKTDDVGFFGRIKKPNLIKTGVL